VLQTNKPTKTPPQQKNGMTSVSCAVVAIFGIIVTTNNDGDYRDKAKDFPMHTEFPTNRDEK
jgi:hypothetical protein